MLYELIYTSVVVAPLAADDIAGILAAAHEKNQRCGVTGMLVCDDRKVVQLFEGSREGVRWTFGRVRRDARHSSIHVLAERALDRRAFAASPMGFRRLYGDRRPDGWGAIETGDPAALAAALRILKGSDATPASIPVLRARPDLVPRHDNTGAAVN